ncbi:VOC family protein [Trinickia dinghuensis]|uniref:VOC family protein n=1 Tax=Trinickia dinghuensis TaxID=2291023 RepID=A0A3D8K657_9BURK|nr:VOC family protein [Trinickia dinghuensis]RDV00396.1 VOC family protein [Trinickia dinghuensis]
MQGKTLPGLMHVDHVALTVPDLDEAVGFYGGVLGAIELYRMGPFDADELPKMPDGTDWTQAHLNIAKARLRFVMMALGKNLMLELFRYERPNDAVTTPPRNCDVGASHIALKVENLDAALEFLREGGIRVMAGPIVIDSGPCAGLRVNYFLDPFGNQLELVEYGHLPFMDGTDAPLYARDRLSNKQ